MKKKAVIEAVVTVLLLAFASVFAIYNTEIYDRIIKDRISGQLEKTYGLSFDVQELDERQMVVPDFGSPLGFTAQSSEGTFTFGECDWKGSLVSENYIHCFYAPSLNSELEGIVGSYFEDCYIVEDFIGYAEAVDAHPVTAGSIANEEEYKTHIDREKTYFRVYLDDGVTDGQIQSALDALESNGYRGNVYFMPVKSDLYKELKDSGMTCYCKHSSVGEAFSGFVSIDRKGMEDLIADPFRFTRAEYVPKWNKSGLID